MSLLTGCEGVSATIELGHAASVLGLVFSLQAGLIMLRRRAEPGREQAQVPVAMLEAISDGVIGLDRQGAVRWANAAATRMLVMTERELVGKPLRAFYQPEGATRGAAGPLAEVLAHGATIHDRTLYLIGGDGRLVERVCSVLPQPGSVGAMIVMRDGSHEALREKSERLSRKRRFVEGLLTNLPSGVAYMNQDLVIEWVNPVLTHLLDQPADCLLGRDAFECLLDPRHKPQIMAILAKGGSYRWTACFAATEAHGAPRDTFWDVTCDPVRDDHGGVVGVLLQFFEVTDRVAHAELQHRRLEVIRKEEALKDDFINTLLHELRAPLTTILGTLSVLESGAAGALHPDQQPLVRSLRRNGRILLRLVSDLLDWSRIQAGQLGLVWRPVDVAMLLEEVVADAGYMARQKQLRLGWTLEPGCSPLMADEQRLWQVLMNLIDNAIRFTPAGGTITLRVRPDGEALAFEIADTGIGIAQRDHERLFERFVRLGSAHGRGGLGLGLSICKALVEAHGGTIGVRSELGRGSTFWFILPSGHGESPPRL